MFNGILLTANLSSIDRRHGSRSGRCVCTDVAVTLAPTRAIVIVLDSVGIGELPDARAYGDQGSNTLGHIARAGAAGDSDAARARPRARGRDSADRADAGAPRGAVGRMAEASAGKDSVTGHWEMMGIVLDRAVPGIS